MCALPTAPDPLPGRSRLADLLEHFSTIHDPRDVRRILHPLREGLLLVVTGTTTHMYLEADLAMKEGHCHRQGGI
jgi:hypothetical protein